MDEFYLHQNSHVHKSVHHLSGLSTDAFNAARERVAKFINAASPRELVWTRNATEAVNIVARSWGDKFIKEGDEILLSVSEHHSNMVPWLQLAQRSGAVVKYAGLTQDEQVDLESVRSLLTRRTKLVSLGHVSNVTGGQLPVPAVKALIDELAAKDCRFFLDSCQGVPHKEVNVQALGADWIALTGHKMCGPTGVGALWGRLELLQDMPPFQGGGEMIQRVELGSYTYADPPERFEAGTPPICEAIGLATACDYLQTIGMDAVAHYEAELGGLLYEGLASIPGVRVYGPKPANPNGRAALCAFNVAGLGEVDLAGLLSQRSGVAIRQGHHCAQPCHRALGANQSARASLYIYNTPQEVEVLVEELKSLLKAIKNGSH